MRIVTSLYSCLTTSAGIYTGRPQSSPWCSCSVRACTDNKRCACELRRIRLRDTAGSLSVYHFLGRRAIMRRIICRNPYLPVLCVIQRKRVWHPNMLRHEQRLSRPGPQLFRKNSYYSVVTAKYLLVKNLERSDWLARKGNKGNEGSDSGAIIWRLCVEGRLLAAG